MKKTMSGLETSVSSVYLLFVDYVIPFTFSGNLHSVGIEAVYRLARIIVISFKSQPMVPNQERCSSSYGLGVSVQLRWMLLSIFISCLHFRIKLEMGRAIGALSSVMLVLMSRLQDQLAVQSPSQIVKKKFFFVYLHLSNTISPWHLGILSKISSVSSCPKNCKNLLQLMLSQLHKIQIVFILSHQFVSTTTVLA